MNKIILILIFISALFLRVYKLGQYPTGFLWDEAALGYNAYSILKTGRDEYEKFLPIIFKSFGDYKPGLYVYLTVPSVMIFGLNEFAVRFPSALIGIMSVVILYLLIKEMFLHKITRIGTRMNSNSLPLISALLLAVSPWHINFSRGAWELNVMLFEFIFGFYFLARFINSKKEKYLYFSAPVFLLTLITYQSAKFLLPVLLSAYLFFFRKELFQSKKKSVLLFSSIILGIFIIFNVLTVLGGKGGRIKAMSLFSYPRSSEESQMLKEQDNNSQITETIFHNLPVFFSRSLLGRYFNHFTGKFLFFVGDWSNPRNGVVYSGVMYLFDAIFLALGLGILFSRKRSPLENFMIYWLLIAPLPSALTRDSISSVRSFTMVIPLVYITATGINGMFEYLNRFRSSVKFTFYILHFTFYIFLIVRFLDLYFVHDPIFTSKDRLYGYKEMINYIKPIIDQKNKVVITTSYGQPYIFYLFYSKYDPKIYQKQAKLKESPVGDVGEVERIDNIEFRKIYWPKDRGIGNSLFVGDEFDLPLRDIVGQENIYFLKEINFLNGKTAFRIVETR